MNLNKHWDEFRKLVLKGTTTNPFGFVEVKPELMEQLEAFFKEKGD